MSLKYPWVLWAFLIYVPLLWWYFKRNKRSTPSLGLSTLAPFANLPRSWKEYLMKFNFILKLLA
ncbi:MAG: BatA domain-containing protein, partial [Muribaculaceae bacterium]|nr:BatA domain-containing protein [Muribaculaceae bacterium]